MLRHYDAIGLRKLIANREVTAHVQVNIKSDKPEAPAAAPVESAAEETEVEA